MADTKISAMGAATTLAAIDLVPIVQAGANKSATLGQLANLANTPVVTTTTNGAAAIFSDVVLISGTVTLASGSVSGKKITLVATAPGTLAVTLQTSLTSYTFASSGATITLIWANSTWNVISLFGMV